jgi:hypothetical protein
LLTIIEKLAAMRGYFYYVIALVGEKLLAGLGKK